MPTPDKRREVFTGRHGFSRSARTKGIASRGLDWGPFDAISRMWVSTLRLTQITCDCSLKSSGGHHSDGDLSYSPSNKYRIHSLKGILS